LTEKIHFNLDWLRAKSDRQLLEYQATIDNMIADQAKFRGTQPPDPVAVRFIAEFLQRTAGFDRGLEYLNALNGQKPEDAFFFTKIRYLLHHGRTNELHAYIQELTERRINSPLFPQLCLEYYLGLGQLQRAGFFLSTLITDYPQSRQLFQAVTLARIFSLDYDQAEFERKVGWGGRFLGLESRILGLADTGELPVVHCINLDRSPQRMARCTELYRDKAGLQRIPGVPGNSLPNYLLDRITTNPALPRSAVGCSLSHIAAWERVAASSEADPLQIIVEDDGLPLFGNRAAFATVRKLMQRQKLDLLYINESATPLEFSIREFSPGWEPEALPFQAGLERYIQHQRRQLPVGWGLYGYCLSVAGARKLLALVDRDGLTNHIDWQTFLYSATDWEHPVVRSKKNVAINYRNTTGNAPRRELNSGILNFPMIAHVDFSRSTR